MTAKTNTAKTETETNEASASSTSTLVIQGMSFQTSNPYSAGHPLTDLEAAALNGLRSENLRNNFAATARAALDEAGVALGFLSRNEAGKIEGKLTDAQKAECISQVDHAALQAKFDEYASSYQFGVRRSGTRAPRVSDPVEKEARAIARQRVVEAIQAKGHKVKDVDTAQLTAYVEKVFAAHRDVLMEQARVIVEARQSAAADEIGLGDLGL